MNYKLQHYEVFGCVFSLIAGTLFHFIYQWSGNSAIIALISPINESIWEHLKLLFFPTLFYAILEYFLLHGAYPNYIAAKLVSVIIGMSAIITLFYTYTGIIGHDIFLFDIAIFIFAVILTYLLSFRFMTRPPFLTMDWALSLGLLLLITLLFVAFTFAPPSLPLFQSP